MIIFRILCVSFFLLLNASSFADQKPFEILQSRCGGSDGPKPLENLLNFKTSFSPLTTFGHVSELYLWESRNAIVYRNRETEIRASRLSGGPENFFLAMSSIPLFRSADPFQRYLVTDTGNFINDVYGQRQWYRFSNALPIKQLFWDRKRLFSVQLYVDQNGYQRMRFFRYRLGDNSARAICRQMILPPGEHVKLADGAAYPYAMLYRVKPGQQGGKKLSLFNFDVGLCRISDAGTYSHEIEGDVDSVHWLYGANAIAVKVNHSEKNLLWDPGTAGGSCRYYNIGGAKPIIVTRNRPMFATWEKGRGLSMVFPSQGKTGETATVLKENFIKSLSPQTVQMTSDGKRLIVAPEFEDGTSSLLQIKLQGEGE